MPAKYLVTEDNGSTHLPYTDESGNIDHGRMGGAWAALHGGYRGSKYDGPDKAKALAKLKAIYESENMTPPAEKCLKGGPGSGPLPSGSAAPADAIPMTPLQARQKVIQARAAAARNRVTPVKFPSAAPKPVLKAAAAQARHIESGKFLPGKEGEASSQAHTASFTARTASQAAQVRGNGDQSARHALAATANTKAAAAHDRAARACDAASCPAMAEYHRQAADTHRGVADSHALVAGMFAQTS